MKQILATITVAVTLVASSASAFDINTTTTEESRMAGKRLISDLTVGVQALIERWQYGCIIDGKLHLLSSNEIETDPRHHTSYYKIKLEPDGEFTMTYGPTGGGTKLLPRMRMGKESCPEYDTTHPELTFIPVKSINGFTDSRSFLVDLINQGYK
jgi:hypothetical protein|tara:strand:- start:4424 stop:4888 length:465 start_codon:yes stop_codon:yes gene_type:complete